jgi:probable rRNA maturation factor
MRGVTIYLRRDFKGIKVPVQKLEKLIRSACRRFKIHNTIVDIAVVDNNQMRKFNARFTNRKTNTDCLSFDLSDAFNKKKLFALIVNGQKAKSESMKRGHSPQAELALYITHGLLHNLDLNDHTPKDAQIMHRLEDELLRQHGFGEAYYRKNTAIINRHLKRC